MRLAALAAILAVAHGTAGPAAAARSDWNDNGGPGFGTGGAMSESDRQSAVVAARSRELVRETQRREADARCGCNSGDAGHAGRAGF